MKKIYKTYNEYLKHFGNENDKKNEPTSPEEFACFAAKEAIKEAERVLIKNK